MEDRLKGNSDGAQLDLCCVTGMSCYGGMLTFQMAFQNFITSVSDDKDASYHVLDVFF